MVLKKNKIKIIIPTYFFFFFFFLSGVKLFTTVTYDNLVTVMKFEAENTRAFDVEVVLDLKVSHFSYICQLTTAKKKKNRGNWSTKAASCRSQSSSAPTTKSSLGTPRAIAKSNRPGSGARSTKNRQDNHHQRQKLPLLSRRRVSPSSHRSPQSAGPWLTRSSKRLFSKASRLNRSEEEKSFSVTNTYFYFLEHLQAEKGGRPLGD